MIFLKKVDDFDQNLPMNFVSINNLPLRHGTDYVQDKISFFREVMDINVTRDSMVACYALVPN